VTLTVPVPPALPNEGVGLPKLGWHRVVVGDVTLVVAELPHDWARKMAMRNGRVLNTRGTPQPFARRWPNSPLDASEISQIAQVAIVARARYNSLSL
jgi:hypothetical protein